jgi:methylase of polypeptide subunit release factors
MPGRDKTQVWKDWYNHIKGSDWPKCDLEKDYNLLPDWVKEKLAQEFSYIPRPKTTNDLIYLTSGIHQIEVFYKEILNGGGVIFSKDFVYLIKHLYPNRVFNTCFEWCAGPGFIGYEILSHKLCKTLCFLDLYNPAINSIEKTKNFKKNNCADLVTTYLTDDISTLPDEEKFDLIVANPPYLDNLAKIPHEIVNYNNAVRLGVDLNWKSHINFFNNIKKHLNNDGIILLLQTTTAQHPGLFDDIISKNEMKITNVYQNFDFFSDTHFKLNCYYLEIKNK